MGFLHNPFIIPLAAFAMVVIIVAIFYWYKARERELQAHHGTRAPAERNGDREGADRVGQGKGEQGVLRLAATPTRGEH